MKNFLESFVFPAEDKNIYQIEGALERLASVIEEKNSTFSWSDVIAFFALIASWVTIFFLLKERYERNRPYLQISFELVRSTLACIVLRNTGTVPLEVKSLTFNEDFVKQLNLKAQERIRRKTDTNIAIFPGQKWVLSFDVNIFNILNDFEEKTVKIGYTYTKYGRRKKHNEKTVIEFDEFRGFLDYISELDEFKNSVSKLQKSMEKTNKALENMCKVLEDS